jgi:hypothetical protein
MNDEDKLFLEFDADSNDLSYHNLPNIRLMYLWRFRSNKVLIIKYKKNFTNYILQKKIIIKKKKK